MAINLKILIIKAKIEIITIEVTNPIKKLIN